MGRLLRLIGKGKHDLLRPDALFLGLHGWVMIHVSRRLVSVTICLVCVLRYLTAYFTIELGILRKLAGCKAPMSC